MDTNNSNYISENVVFEICPDCGNVHDTFEWTCEDYSSMLKDMSANSGSVDNMVEELGKFCVHCNKDIPACPEYPVCAECEEKMQVEYDAREREHVDQLTACYRNLEIEQARQDLHNSWVCADEQDYLERSV